MSANGEAAPLRRRALRSCGPSMKRKTSPTVICSADRASRYPPSAPHLDSTKPPCFNPARISSRNFCGIFCRLATSAILTGSPGFWEARSNRACSAYSPLTEMFKLEMVTCDQCPRNLAEWMPPPDLARLLENRQCLLIEILRNCDIALPAFEFLIRGDRGCQNVYIDPGK